MKSLNPNRTRAAFVGAGLILIIALVGSGGVAAQSGEAAPVDFTEMAAPPENGPHDWTLGSTGARGYFQVRGESTRSARQIWITAVAEGSPAAAHLRVGDVILGIDAIRFTEDARRTVAEAITAAEAATGELSLVRWRDGDVQTVTLQLPTLGAFGPRAPYDCVKSEAILRAGCAELARRGLDRISIPNHINALALLAADDPAYDALVRDYAHRAANEDLTMERSLHSWSYAFSNLFLTEYYLHTEDEAVLPTIRRLTLDIARGQSVLGNWGHRFVRPELGRLGGYGSINSVSVPLAISLVLARECGIDDPSVDEAIARSADFYRRYVDLGSIPYGDHPPNLQYGHDDNGKNASAAIFFELLEDEQAADYYRRMALAAYDSDREQGHTGNFFNMLWSLPGVSRAGPDATGAWLAAFGWYYDLARDWRYGFPYQGNPESRRDAYHSWYCPGAYLLHFALPRRAIRLTGSGSSGMPPLDPAAIRSVLDAGRTDVATLPTAELIERLNDWSPVARFRAGRALASRESMAADRLMAALVDPDPVAQRAGLVALAYWPSDSAEPSSERRAALFVEAESGLTSSRPDIAAAAVRALEALDRPRAAEVFITWLATHELQDPPLVSQAIIYTLFEDSQRRSDLVFGGIEDRVALLAAIRRLLQHEDARIVGMLGRELGSLSDDEIRQLMPDLARAGQQEPAGNVMFMAGRQLVCLELLAKHQIAEGIEPLVTMATREVWGRKQSAPRALAVLARYGQNASAHLPVLREALDGLSPDSGNDRLRAQFETTIRALEDDVPPGPPISAEVFSGQRDPV